jgi:hypothetical protein
METGLKGNINYERKRLMARVKKLSEGQTTALLKDVKEGVPYSELVIKYKITKGTISKIRGIAEGKGKAVIKSSHKAPVLGLVNIEEVINAFVKATFILDDYSYDTFREEVERLCPALKKVFEEFEAIGTGDAVDSI